MEKSFLHNNSIICLGAGESLIGFDFSLLDKFCSSTVISCNQMMFHYDKIEHLVFLDYSFFEKNYDEIRDYRENYNRKSYLDCRIHVPADFLHRMALSDKMHDRFLFIESMMPMSFFRESSNYLNHKTKYDSQDFGSPARPYMGELSGLTMLSLALQLAQRRLETGMTTNIFLFGYDFFGGHCYNAEDLLFKDEQEAIVFLKKTTSLIEEFPELRGRIFSLCRRPISLRDKLHNTTVMAIEDFIEIASNSKTPLSNLRKEDSDLRF